MSRPRFSARVILPIAKITLENARANLDALAGFGITAERLDEFEKRIESARKLPTEEVNKLKVKTETRNKNQALRNCFEWGQDLRIRMIWVFGKKSVMPAPAFLCSPMCSGGSGPDLAAGAIVRKG